MRQETTQEKMLRVAAIEAVAMQLFAMENETPHTWARNSGPDVKYYEKRRAEYRQRAIELLAEAMP